MRISKTETDELHLWLTANDTYNWAHRDGSAWPCSQLSGKRVHAEFDGRGDLVDFSVEGRRPEIDANEFNAITSDFIRTKYPNHPAIRN